MATTAHMSAADFHRLTDCAAQALRENNSPVTPENIERIVNAFQRRYQAGQAGKFKPSIEQSLRAMSAQLDAVRTTIGSMNPMQGRKVVAMYLEPDGTPHKVIAEQVQESDKQSKVWIQADGPLSRAKEQLSAIQRTIDHPGTSPSGRAAMQAQEQAVRSQIEAMQDGHRRGTHDIDGNPV